MLPPLGVDMYLPAFLNIAQDLNVSQEQIQHTLTFLRSAWQLVNCLGTCR